MACSDTLWIGRTKVKKDLDLKDLLIQVMVVLVQ